MQDGQPVQKAHVLKQFDVRVADLKKGDIFRLSVRDEQGNLTQSEWMVAVTDAVVSPDGELSIQSDTVHLVMGRPELVSFTVRRGEITKKPLTPQAVQPRQGATT